MTLPASRSLLQKARGQESGTAACSSLSSCSILPSPRLCSSSASFVPASKVTAMACLCQSHSCFHSAGSLTSPTTSAGGSKLCTRASCTAIPAAMSFLPRSSHVIVVHPSRNSSTLPLSKSPRHLGPSPAFDREMNRRLSLFRSIMPSPPNTRTSTGALRSSPLPTAKVHLYSALVMPPVTGVTARVSESSARACGIRAATICLAERSASALSNLSPIALTSTPEPRGAGADILGAEPRAQPSPASGWRGWILG
mmetsp:Transcript_46489/g.113208  ORF Transcript_46489/g.113208 Transcript_46489/m.113208 type:complete len:254 (-) Transcript_46489:69-830(-)